MSSKPAAETPPRAPEAQEAALPAQPGKAGASSSRQDPSRQDSSRRDSSPQGPEPPAAAPARRAAFAVLLRLEAAAPHALPPRPDSLIARLEDASRRPPDDRDRALARELIFGVLRWRRSLDFALDTYCRRPVATLDPPVRIALRLGLYQLRFLDRVPARAAVHDSVSLAAAGARAGHGASGLVNAVLRSYLRADHPWPRPGGDPRLYLRVGLSHPDWLVDRYLEMLGEKGARRRFEANNRTPTTFLRVGRRRDVDEVRRALQEQGVQTERFPLAPRCLRTVSGNPQASSLHEEGAFHIQDAGSQLVGWLLPLDGARRCLDACAAPGGKATLLAERLDPCRLIAADLRPRRAALLAATARTLAAANLVPLSADASAPPFRAESFDRVLLDAPCSGLGTLSRNPDIKWTASPERLAALGAAALGILRGALRLLAPGGMLLYSACSLEPEETSAPVLSVLHDFPGIRQISLTDRLPEPLWGLVDEDGALRLAPEDRGTDGYYAALLARAST